MVDALIFALLQASAFWLMTYNYINNIRPKLGYLDTLFLLKPLGVGLQKIPSL